MLGESRPRSAVVVGGGIAGLASAVALARVGVRVVVVERARALEPVGAGISLSPNATRVLRRLGVLESLLPSAGILEGATIRAPDGKHLARVPTGGRATPFLCVHRSDLVGVLQSALPGGVHLGRGVEWLDDRGAGVQVALEGGEVLEADFVVGADGIRSRVRAHVVGDDPPEYQGYVAWRGMAPLPEGAAAGTAVETMGDGLRFGFVPCGPGRGYWYATANRPDPGPGGKGDAEDRKAELLRLFGEWHDPIPDLLERTPPGAILLDGIHDREPRRGWWRGRVVLVGDAAHPTTPNLGQGGAMALEDAEALALALAGSASLEDAFRSFESIRFPRTRRVTLESRRMGRVGQLGGGAAALRNLVLAAVPDALMARQGRWLVDHPGPVAGKGNPFPPVDPFPTLTGSVTNGGPSDMRR